MSVENSNSLSPAPSVGHSLDPSHFRWNRTIDMNQTNINKMTKSILGVEVAPEHQELNNRITDENMDKKNSKIPVLGLSKSSSFPGKPSPRMIDGVPPPLSSSSPKSTIKEDVESMFDSFPSLKEEEKIKCNFKKEEMTLEGIGEPGDSSNFIKKLIGKLTTNDGYKTDQDWSEIEWKCFDVLGKIISIISKEFKEIKTGEFLVALCQLDDLEREISVIEENIEELKENSKNREEISKSKKKDVKTLLESLKNKICDKCEILNKLTNKTKSLNNYSNEIEIKEWGDVDNILAKLNVDKRKYKETEKKLNKIRDDINVTTRLHGIAKLYNINNKKIDLLNWQVNEIIKSKIANIRKIGFKDDKIIQGLTQKNLYINNPEMGLNDREMSDAFSKFMEARNLEEDRKQAEIKSWIESKMFFYNKYMNPEQFELISKNGKWDILKKEGEEFTKELQAKMGIGENWIMPRSSLKEIAEQEFPKKVSDVMTQIQQMETAQKKGKDLMDQLDKEATKLIMFVVFELMEQGFRVEVIIKGLGLKEAYSVHPQLKEALDKYEKARNLQKNSPEKERKILTQPHIERLFLDKANSIVRETVELIQSKLIQPMEEARKTTKNEVGLLDKRVMEIIQSIIFQLREDGFEDKAISFLLRSKDAYHSNKYPELKEALAKFNEARELEKKSQKEEFELKKSFCETHNISQESFEEKNSTQIKIEPSFPDKVKEAMRLIQLVEKEQKKASEALASQSLRDETH